MRVSLNSTSFPRSTGRTTRGSLIPGTWRVTTLTLPSGRSSLDKTSISFVPSFSFCGDGAGGSRVSFGFLGTCECRRGGDDAEVAVRGIRSGRGTHVEPLIRWMLVVVDVHRRFAAQVHGHLELHHGDDLTPGAGVVSRNVPSTPRSLTPSPSPFPPVSGGVRR